MRIWSLHPKYLDTKGLVALWRETLLAKNVLENKTKGYKNHPQLERFKNSDSPLENINYYLSIVFDEARRRNFVFNETKFIRINICKEIFVNDGQLVYEMNHLINKLKLRDPLKLEEIKKIRKIEAHPLFKISKGDIETWEKNI